MRRLNFYPLLGLFALMGCGSDDGTGVPDFAYTLTPATPTVSVGQDSTVLLGITVEREDLTAPLTGVRLVYSSADPDIAVVDGAGIVTGVRGGETTINIAFGTTTVAVPVTVRGHPATLVQLSVLTGPAGGLLIGNPDVGEFYALPADRQTSRLKGLVLVGADTVFCNYCAAPPPIPPSIVAIPRTHRIVRFRSLDPDLATVNNANNPRLQSSIDTTGRVTPRDTSAIGVRIVMEVPSDSGVADKWADTVLVKLSLRPLDSLRLRPDSANFPTTDGTGLRRGIYPNSDNTQANVIASTNVNFVLGVDFTSRVQDINPAGSTAALPAIRLVTSRVNSTNPEIFRPSVPALTFESANPNYVTVNAAGAVTGICAFISSACSTANAAVLTCAANAGTMPAAFLGVGSYSIPSCVPSKSIPMPGAFCATTVDDLAAMCSVWIRVSAHDPTPPPPGGKILQSLYRINTRR